MAPAVKYNHTVVVQYQRDKPEGG